MKYKVLGISLCIITHLPLITIDTKGVDIPGKPVTENHTRVGYTTAEDGSDCIQAQMAVFDDEEKIIILRIRLL